MAKIVLVSRVYPTLRPGGMGFVCQDRAEALSAMGHEVTVLTTGRDPNGEGWMSQGGVAAVTAPNAEPGLYSDEFARWLVDKVASIDPTVLHLDSFDNRRNWWRDSRISGRGMPIACTMHGFGMGAAVGDLIGSVCHDITEVEVKVSVDKVRRERDLMKTFDTLIAISLNEWWLMRDALSLSNSAYVPNPIAPYFFNNVRRRQSERRRFLCGAITPMKGRKLKSVERICKRNSWEHVNANVVRREDMPSLYDDATALVYPSLYFQASSLMVDEALARGCPVIGYDRGPFAFDQRPGIYKVQPGNPEALEDAMAADMPICVMQCEDNRPDFHADQWLDEVLG